MKVLVLKPFPWSPDGARIQHLAADDEPDIQDDLVAGLKAEGFIATKGVSRPAIPAAPPVAKVAPPPVVPPPEAKVASAIEIPATWEALQWFSLKKLAEEISGGPVVNKVAAGAVVTAELARRAA